MEFQSPEIQEILCAKRVSGHGGEEPRPCSSVQELLRAPRKSDKSSAANRQLRPSYGSEHHEGIRSNA